MELATGLSSTHFPHHSKHSDIVKISLVAGDETSLVPGTKLETETSSTTSSWNRDSSQASSLLARTPAAPSYIQPDITNNNSASPNTTANLNKALKYSTSNQNSSSSENSSIFDKTENIFSPPFFTDELLPQLDGAFDPEYNPSEDEDWLNTQRQQQKLTPSTDRKPVRKSKKPQLEGRDDENITLRTPLEVYKDLLEDTEALDKLTDVQKESLNLKSQQLLDITPSCNCAQEGLPGMYKEFNALKCKIVMILFCS